mmetsp:Transcript_49848/g.159353  ORF Transcript_49848/g.159353 Transcript_49848/m.159353 type:complete len:149 (-) Transcript_49848:446-892(-)
MRAVVQRVLSASVDVEGKRVSTIGPGLLCLIGIKDGDTEADAEYICKKILTSKLFENEDTERAWDKNVVDRNYEVLCVSQFTLFASTKKNKPDFHRAMPPQASRPFYEGFIQQVQKAYREDMVKGAPPPPAAPTCLQFHARIRARGLA